MIRPPLALTFLLLSIIIFSCSSSEQSVEKIPPVVKPQSEDVAPSWVEETLSSLTLREKVAQMVMARAFGHYISATSNEYQRLVRLVEEERVGGLVVFQGDVYEQAVLLNKLQKWTKIPLLVAADYERGVAMRTRRGTYFPDAMALGATRNPDFAYRVGKSIALEARAIGVHQNFAPVADVNNNPANPVINTRSFGEDLALVNQMVGAFVKGSNDGGVISTAKHFPGHGDTGTDSHLDLPVLPFDRKRLDSLELVPFRYAIDNGVASVMIAHLEVPALDSGKSLPASLSPSTITGVLKNELGFQGLVVTDAMDMRGLMRGNSIGDVAVKAVKAGVDILLMPTNERATIDAVVEAVERGEISEDRINTSVEKILRAKSAMRLDEEPLVDIDRIAEVVASKDHVMLAKEVARNAVTVVRNSDNILPLQHRGKKKIVTVIISDIDDNRTEVNRPSQQWTNEAFGAYFTQQFRRRHTNVETFRLTPSSNRLDFDSVLTRMKRADIVLMPLYAKVRSASGTLGIPDRLLPFIARAESLAKPTVVISFGNPYVVAAFPKASGLMCAYTDAEVMVEAAVEGLFGEIDVRGRLPVTIPGVFPFGTGLLFARSELRVDDPAFAGFDERRLERVDSIILAAIADSAFPAAQVAVVKDGIVVYNKSFGNYTYDRAAKEIDDATLFDIASLTKVVATTSAIMKLYDQKEITLNDSIGKFIPQFNVGRKAGITIRHLLTHTSGLPAFRKLWGVGATPQATLDSALAIELVANPGDTTIYSDLSILTLGHLVEKITGMSLDAYVRREFFEPLKMVSTTFKPSKAVWEQVAPTEYDSVWRKALVQGTVHDENAAALGGVAGHAGLFSNASDLSIFMQMIMNRGTYGGVRFFSDSTVSRFTQRQSQRSTRALGWDTKSATGSSAGTLFSQSSFGHTGFAGTSIWADPERKLFVILLTNRVYPMRANNKILKVRPLLHDLVVQALR
ncbi:MAG: glycoside hydrolase family 3 N-terminal domain-containing protein [Bacteroidota bacterium]